MDFALYLRALGWPAVQISGVLSAGLLVGAALTLLVGPFSDRAGRRLFLLAYEASQLVAISAALLSARPWLLAAAAVGGGFGRGANGAAGPFSPVEQAWLAQSLPPERRGPIYSLNAASGFLGMAFGAILAALPSKLQATLPGALAYRPLFLVALLGSLLCFALILWAHDTEADERHPVARHEPTSRGVQRRENGLLLRLMFANAMNGIGVGLTGPLVAYWFAVRFGEGPEKIGPLMAGGFAMAALASLATGRLSRAVGVVRAVVAMRLVGLVLLVALPFAPSFALAGALYVGRAVFNRGTSGARNALSVSIVRQRRRGFAASMANVSMQVPRAISPVFTGLLFEAGHLALPFLIGAAFQAAYIIIYDRSFRNSDPGRKAA